MAAFIWREARRMERAMGEARRIGQELRHNSQARMIGWEWVVGALATSHSQFERDTRRAEHPTVRDVLRRWAVRWLIFLTPVAFAVLALSSARQTHDPGDWIGFWTGVGITAIFSLALLPSMGAFSVDPRLPGALALRDDAARGDDTLAPRSTWQPSPLDIAISTDAPLVLRRLYRADALFALPTHLILTVLGLAAGLTQIPANESRPTFSLLVALWTTCFGLISALRLVGLVRGFDVTVDEVGLTWRARGRRQRAAWQDIRALGVIDLSRYGLLREDERVPLRRVYVLDAGDVILTWTPSLSGRHRYRSDGLYPDWQLCRLVVSRTGLPLRDLTREAVRLAFVERPRTRLWAAPAKGDWPRRALAYLPLALAWAILVTLVLAGVFLTR